MKDEKSFVIQTEIMSADRLTQYGLRQFDTRNASDHFPKITDYSFNATSVTAEDFQPMDFKLEQNYPNPFNPSTSIQYAIGSKQFVRLRVFDVLGEEVATLVNEELSAGSYKAEFNASDLVSGIYFYELNAGRFVETKKMILLR